MLVRAHTAGTKAVVDGHEPDINPDFSQHRIFNVERLRFYHQQLLSCHWLSGASNPHFLNCCQQIWVERDTSVLFSQEGSRAATRSSAKEGIGADLDKEYNSRGEFLS